MVTPLGLNRADSFHAALIAKSAIAPAPLPILKLRPHALAAQVSGNFEAGQTRAVTSLDRATQFALVATQEALADAGYQASDLQKNRTGIYVGIGMGGAYTIETLYTRFFELMQLAKTENRDPTIIHPLAVPRMMANSGAAAISIQHQLRGPTFTYSIACASSAVAIGEAMRALRHGYIDTAIVIGTEAMLTPGSSEIGRAHV